MLGSTLQGVYGQSHDSETKPLVDTKLLDSKTSTAAFGNKPGLEIQDPDSETKTLTRKLTALIWRLPGPSNVIPLSGFGMVFW